MIEPRPIVLKSESASRSRCIPASFSWRRRRHQRTSEKSKKRLLMCGEKVLRDKTTACRNSCGRMLFYSREDASKTFRALFPPGKERPEDCTVPELKAMIAGRGGTVMALGGAALNKPDLIPLLRKYIFMEQQRRGHHSPVFFDCSQSNGVFTKIDTSGNASIGEMLQLMAAEKNFDTRWLSFITDTVDLYNHGRFNSDFEWIATHSPELKESLIFKTFLQIGNSESQKSLKESLGRVLEMNERLYHAMAWSEDKRFVTIISKQRASMGHEEKKNKKENVGERPEFKEYLVFTRYRVESMTEESHGHTLGESLLP